MKKLLSLIVLISSVSVFGGDSCKVMIVEDKGWFPDEIKKVFEGKNYEFVSRAYGENNVDYIVSYVPMTAGIYPGAGRSGKSKRFVTFQVKKPYSSESVIWVEKGSKRKNFSYLMSNVTRRALKSVNRKIPTCN